MAAGGEGEEEVFEVEAVEPQLVQLDAAGEGQMPDLLGAEPADAERRRSTCRRIEV